MFRGTDGILQYILHIQFECEKYFVKHCQCYGYE